MTTCALPPSGGQVSLDLALTSSPAAPRASRSPVSASASEPVTLAGDGRGCSTWFARFDRATSSWRTSPTLFETDATETPSELSSPDWPVSGSMRSGHCYPRAQWVPHTHVSACFWWPTPPRHDGEQPVHLPASVPGGRAGAGAAGRPARGDWWLSEPDVDRVAHGLPKRVVAPALHAFGNAVVPQVAERIGQLIMAADAEQVAA
jgi:hypothetical protein